MNKNLAHEEAQKLVSQIDEITRKYADDITEVLWNFKNKHHIPVEGFSTLEEAQAQSYDEVTASMGFDDLEALVDILASQVTKYAEE